MGDFEKGIIRDGDKLVKFIKDLGSNEKVVHYWYHWDQRPLFFGLRAGEPMYNSYVITNQRAVITNSGGKTKKSCKLNEITVKVGTNSKELHFFKGNKHLFYFDGIDAHEAFSYVNKINSQSKSDKTQETKSTESAPLPKDPPSQSSGSPMPFRDTLPKEIEQTETVSENPLKILKLRFAKGEISKEEFEEMKGMLE